MSLLESERLVLRELDLDDAEFILELLNEPAFVRFIGDKGVRTLADAREYLQKGPMDSYRRLGFGLYLASLRADGTPIGMCGLVKREGLADVDVGFALRSRYWSQGYAAGSGRGRARLRQTYPEPRTHRRHRESRQPGVHRGPRKNRSRVRAHGSIVGRRAGAQAVRAGGARESTVTAQFTPILGILYALSEAGLLWLRRSGKAAADADRGSLPLIWVVIFVSICAAFALAPALPRLALGAAGACRAAGATVFAAGIIVRWYAILALGRFFTVNVAIASDHRLVEAGPYRLLRHPSYTGALLAFLGLGICMRQLGVAGRADGARVGGILAAHADRGGCASRDVRRAVPRLHAPHSAFDPVHLLVRASPARAPGDTMHPFPHHYTVARGGTTRRRRAAVLARRARHRVGAAEGVRRAGQSMVARAAVHRRGRGLLRARLSAPSRRVQVPLARAAGKHPRHAGQGQGKMRFTRFETHAKLHVPTGTDRRARQETAREGGDRPAWSRTRSRASATCRWRSSRAACGTPRGA